MGKKGKVVRPKAGFKAGRNWLTNTYTLNGDDRGAGGMLQHKK
jgi:hypothetical protein